MEKNCKKKRRPPTPASTPSPFLPRRAAAASVPPDLEEARPDLPPPRHHGRSAAGSGGGEVRPAASKPSDPPSPCRRRHRRRIRLGGRREGAERAATAGSACRRQICWQKTRGLGDLLNSSAGPKLTFGCMSVPVDLILQSTRNEDKETVVKSINDRRSTRCRWHIIYLWADVVCESIGDHQ